MSKKKVVIIIAIVAIGIIVIAALASNNVSSMAPPMVVESSERSSLPATSSDSSVAATSSATPSLDAQPEITGKDPVEYQNQTIVLKYHDISTDKTLTEETPLEGSAPLEKALDVVSQIFFNKPLSESPASPNSVFLAGNSIYIDFKGTIIDNTNWGSGSEISFLDAVSDVYLDNLESVDNVYISVDGQNYSSGHIEIPKSKPFKSAT